MNILRWKRKSKKKIKFKTLILFIFSLIMTTFAWFAYSKILNTTLNIHIASWDMEYWIGTVQQTNPENGIEIDISTLYPTMKEKTVTVDIYNNGETLVDITYQVKAVTIAGTEYEIVQEGATNTKDDYIALASPVLETNANGEQVYKSVITNDINKFPFTIEIEHSAEVQPFTTVPGEGYLKVTVNWIGDNNELDTKWGYIVGEYLENNPTSSAISILLSIDSYQAENQERETITVDQTLPSTTQTTPYLPTGFSKVSGTNLDTGLVIKDASGNEYVWVEVPKSADIYKKSGLSLDLDTLSVDALTAAYSNIETDLKAYAADYTTREETYTSDYNIIGLSEPNYNLYKQKMLKSVYENGGFYIGRYETGIADSYRTASGDITQTAVIKANAYPYNYVTCFQAHELAYGMASGDYTSSLMFGLQWDLTMKYLETKGTLPAMLKKDSSTWGNYSNSIYTLTKSSAKYMISTDWLTITLPNPYEKSSGVQALLGTGANTTFSNQNIYDLAGNLAEWTYNIIYSDTDLSYFGGNGGDYSVSGTNAATYCGTYDPTASLKQVGFRVTIY